RFLHFPCFFFSSRRRHTSFSRDWSSDVCSSDLFLPGEEMEQRVDAAKLVRELGFEPIVHLSARRLTSKEELDSYLVRITAEAGRSEERRVGKECRSRWPPSQLKDKRQSLDGMCR